ncbi:MAG: hypothetical protein JXR91_03105 [Deltaproteobacteria bacterium]|nr:hypothetical protein [Deltaproteobacteria bacterium]
MDPSKTEIVVLGKGERPGALDPQFIWVSGNPVLESELDKVRLSFAKTAIIIGSRDTDPAMADAATIMTLFTMKSFVAKERSYEKRETPLYIVAEILDPQNMAHAKTAGADEIIETTRLGFAMMAHAATFPGSGKIMTGVATGGAHSLYISKNPENTMSFEELYDLLHKKYKIILLRIKDNTTKEINMDPANEVLVKDSMDIVYLAKQPL